MSSTFDPVNPPERLRSLQVETTTWCSLKCAGCGRTIKDGLGKWTDRHMSATRFQRIVDHSPPAEVLCIQGVGEPTLNPELREIVSIARHSGKYNFIYFSTHGLARNAAYFQGLIDAGLSYFRVSVDSFDPENAERLRAGTDVVKLQNRIRSFAASRLPFGIHTTVSRHNLEELSETLMILNELAEIHRFEVAMHNLVSCEGEEYANGPNYSSWVLDYSEIKMMKDRLPEWVSRFPNIDIVYEPIYDGLVDTPIGICDAPRTEPWVGVDGTWGVCGYSANTKVLGPTSIEDVPFDRAWRSDVPQRFLERYAAESPSFCDACPRNCGRFSPKREIDRPPATSKMGLGQADR